MSSLVAALCLLSCGTWAPFYSAIFVSWLPFLRFQCIYWCPSHHVHISDRKDKEGGKGKKAHANCTSHPWGAVPNLLLYFFPPQNHFASHQPYIKIYISSIFILTRKFPVETHVVFAIVGCPIISNLLLLLEDSPPRHCVSSYQEQGPASYYKTQRNNILPSLPFDNCENMGPTQSVMTIRHSYSVASVLEKWHMKKEWRELHHKGGSSI